MECVEDPIVGGGPNTNSDHTGSQWSKMFTGRRDFSLISRLETEVGEKEMGRSAGHTVVRRKLEMGCLYLPSSFIRGP